MTSKRPGLAVRPVRATRTGCAKSAASAWYALSHPKLTPSERLPQPREETTPTDIPIACQLGVFSADERRRYHAVRAEIDAAVTRMVEADNGYVFHLPGDDATLARVADWISLERRCCPFFEFSVAIGGSDPSIRVALTGSPEVKRFLAVELRSRTVSPSALVRQR